MSPIKFTFDLTGWDETPIETTSSTLKFTRVRSTYVYKGELAGTGTDESVFVYHPAPEGSGEMYATYSGLLHFEGTLNGREGEAVFISSGTYTKAGGPVSEWKLDEKGRLGAFEGMTALGGDKLKEGGDGKQMEGWLEVKGA